MGPAHEIRSTAQLDLPGVGQGWTEKEMKLARQLMDTLSDSWDPKEFRDTYTDVLREAIEAKVAGKEPVAPARPRRPRVASLMDALQQSLSERPLAKAEGHKATSRRRPRAGRRRAA